MNRYKQLEQIGFSKHRRYTILYCRACRSFIGEIHQRLIKTDFFNPDLCRCSRGLMYDLTLNEIVEHYRPALNYLKPLPFQQKHHDIGRVVRVRSKVESGVVP